MKSFSLVVFSIVVMALVTIGHSIPLNDDKAIFCYFGSWATYRKGIGNFEVANIETDLCTHVIYSFAMLNEITYKIESADPWNDLDINGGKGNYKKVIRLKAKNPNLKVLLAIGGWNEGSLKYSLMSTSKKLRATFVESVVKYLTKYKFDGLDFDWEYPTLRDGSPDDLENFVLLLKELKVEFESRKWLLTIAAGGFDPQDIYDVPAIGKTVDYVNLMTYDYVTALTTDATALHASFGDVKLGVNAWLDAGVPKNKLNLGIPFHARTFTLSDPNDNDLEALSDGPGQKGQYTQEAGSLSYYEVLDKFDDDEWKVVKGNAEVLESYASKGRQWMCYDDEHAVAEKAKYAVEQGLGGVMVWSVELDDFRGTYSDVKYPLLRAINKELNGKA